MHKSIKFSGKFFKNISRPNTFVIKLSNLQRFK